MAEKKKNPLELFLFTDEPVRDLEHDHLGLEPFSSMVAAAALTNRGPFNIGVFSGWGQGKTTVLRQAQALIEDEKTRLKEAAGDSREQPPLVITAWLNAWQYENEAHPIIPLLAIIINQITAAIESEASTHEREDVLLRKTFGDLTRALRAIAYGFSFKAAGLTISAKDMIDRDEELSSKSDPLLDQSLYYRAFSRLEKFCADLNKQQNPLKIIVFIDDLDRCQPDKAVQLLESLKLVLAQPGFVFIIAVDRAVIDSFLTKRYHREFGNAHQNGHGKRYMDKIIQLPLELPHHTTRFPDYLGKLAQADKYQPIFSGPLKALSPNTDLGKQFAVALAAGCNRNPRTLIRTLNCLIADVYLRKRTPVDGKPCVFGEDEDEFLAFAAVSRIAMMTLGSDQQLRYRQLVQKDQSCEDLAAHFKDPAKQKPQPISFFEEIAKHSSLIELGELDIGQRWLTDHPKRHHVEGFLNTHSAPLPKQSTDSHAIIENAATDVLDLPQDTQLTAAHRVKVTALDLSYTLLSDLSSLEAFPNLKRLNLTSTLVKDLTPLEGLARIERLDLNYSTLETLQSLGKLTNLQILNLLEATSGNFDFISALRNLRVINLAFTQFEDFTPFRDLQRIEIIDVRSTLINSIDPLEKCTSLKALYLDGTGAGDISVLSGLQNLEKLSLTLTPVTDLEPLYGLKHHLKRLWLENTSVTNNEDLMKALREALPETNISP